MLCVAQILRSLTLAGLVVGLGGCVSVSFTPQHTILAAERVALPTVEAEKFLLVEARVNGAGPYRFFVDTGASTLILSTKVAKAAGLKSGAGHVVILKTPAGDVRSTAAVVRRFESGGLRLENLAAVVVPDADLAPLAGAFGAEGVLGMTAVRDLVLEMDFPARQISAVRPGSRSYPVEVSVPYEGLSPIVQLEVHGKTVRALVDTGSNFHLIVPDMASYPLVQPPLKDDGFGGFAVGSKKGGREENGQLAGEARLGPLRWSNPPMRWQRSGTEANIGVAALNHIRLIVDQKAQRLYFEGTALEREWPRKKIDMKFKLGFFAVPDPAGIMRLVEVDGGGAFDLAGLRADDLIAAIDGRTELTEALAARPKRKLGVVREGRAFEVEVILAPEKESSDGR
jgi:predicted aspartyl protease